MGRSRISPIRVPGVGRGRRPDRGTTAAGQGRSYGRERQAGKENATRNCASSSHVLTNRPSVIHASFPVLGYSASA